MATATPATSVTKTPMTENAKADVRACQSALDRLSTRCMAPGSAIRGIGSVTRTPIPSLGREDIGLRVLYWIRHQPNQ